MDFEVSELRSDELGVVDFVVLVVDIFQSVVKSHIAGKNHILTKNEIVEKIQNSEKNQIVEKIQILQELLLLIRDFSCSVSSSRSFRGNQLGRDYSDSIFAVFSDYLEKMSSHTP